MSDASPGWQAGGGHSLLALGAEGTNDLVALENAAYIAGSFCAFLPLIAEKQTLKGHPAHLPEFKRLVRLDFQFAGTVIKKVWSRVEKMRLVVRPIG